MDRIRVMERSLACYAYGWLSCIPLLGMAAAVRAIRLYHQVRVEVGTDWNPADRYLFFGLLLAWVGSFISLLTLVLVFIAALKATNGL